MIYTRLNRAIILTAVSLFMNACQDLTSKLPAGVEDPKYYITPQAAHQMAANVRYEFQANVREFFRESGIITDELDDKDSLQRIPGEFDNFLILTQRHLPDEAIDNTPLSGTISQIKSYGGLQRIRSIASLARIALEVYAPESLPSERGEMYIYEALANVMLADLYCSGIPLSTVDFNQDYTYRPGSRTIDVYKNAVSLFDSALKLTVQDPKLTALAQVGKARALLALGNVMDAAVTVRGISQDFQFEMPVFVASNGSTSLRLTTSSIGDRKGEIGLPFISAKDPRISVELYTGGVWVPKSQSEILIASYVEAKLIEAESLIQVEDESFIDVLNDLRTDGTFMVQDGDTIYNAGTGKVTGLRPLQDPAVETIPAGQTALDVRIDLLMEERAFWLFLTGHRQGDLRRLIRNYGRSVENVYPRGKSKGGFGGYDAYVDVPVPTTERFNPHFFGCLGRGE